MLRKATCNRLVTDGWSSRDPADDAIIEGVYKKNLREGEERLMLAVLESAVEDFQKYVLVRKPSGKKLFREAEEWFLEKESGGVLFSFEGICETLQLHPAYIRQGLMLWKETKLKASSADEQRTAHPKLARGRIKQPAIRLSKTA